MQSQSAIQAQLNNNPLTKEEIKKLEKYMKGKSIKKQKYLDLYLGNAIRENNYEMWRLLIRAGANVDSIRNKYFDSIVRSLDLVRSKLGACSASLDLAKTEYNSRRQQQRILEKEQGQIECKYPDFNFDYTELNIQSEEAELLIKACVELKVPVDVIEQHISLHRVANVRCFNNLFRLLISIGENPNHLEHGDPPFMRIYGEDKYEKAKLLINSGLNINYISESGTPLHHACYLMSEEVVQLLLEKKANINTVGGIFKAPPFFSSISNEKLSDTFILKLIPEIINIDQKWGSCGWSYLEHACIKKRKQVIQMLLERGANPKNISQEIYNQLDADIKELLTPKIIIALLETAKKIVSRLIRNISDDRKLKKLTSENIVQLKDCIAKALCAPGLIVELIDDNDPTVIQLRIDLAKAMESEILSCIHNDTFNAEYLTIITKEAVVLWKKKRVGGEKGQNGNSNLQNVITAAALSIVNGLMRNISDEKKLKKFTSENIIQLKDCIAKALSIPGLIDELIDDTSAQVIQSRRDLAAAMQNEVLSCIHKYTFNAEELTSAVQEAVVLWKGKKAADEKAQKAAEDQQKATAAAALAQTKAEAARARVQAEDSARASERIYSTPAVQQTFYAPPAPTRSGSNYQPPAPRENRAADNLNAVAGVLNAFAKVEQGIAADVTAFQGLSIN